MWRLCTRAAAAFLASALCAIAAHPPLASAADIDRWSLCMGGGVPAKAIEACSAIIDSGRELPDSLPYAYLYRGRAYQTLQQVDSAFSDFDAALKFHPQLAHAHFGLGQIYELREEWTHAATEFALAAGSLSEDADIDAFTADAEGTFRADSLVEYGYSLYKAGALGQALGALDEAAKLCPTCSAPWRDKALVFDAQQKSDEAGAAVDRAIALNPRSTGAFFVRGVLKARAGKTAQAIVDYDEALRLDAGFDRAAKARANALKRLGKPPNGPTAADKALAAPALDDAALTKLFSANTWQARQGPWLATLEFRGDGTFRQRSKDTSEGSTLDVTLEGIWGVSRGKVCIFTNVELCLDAHQAGGDIALGRTGQGGNSSEAVPTQSVVEYWGAAADFKNLSADAVSDPVAEFPVEEMLLPAPPGVAKGLKTLFYYIHGFDGHARNHSPLPEYFVSEIQNTRGWDVIDGNYPRTGVNEIRRAGGSNFGSAVFLARRLKELKAQGYQRIYVGGQSWGGWTSLDLATMPGLPLDGVVLVVPACGGWRSTGPNRDDPSYENNKIFFDQLIARARYPTAAVFFLGDEYEPGERGAGAAEVLTRRGVANLIIDHPPGFSGHGSAWFPAFDYLYGDCIANFLESPRTGQCPQRRIPLDVGDFRGIVSEQQLNNRHLSAPTLAELKDRQFAVYPQGELRNIASADQTKVKGYGIGDSLQSSSFRGNSYCWRAPVKYNQPETTDETCERLIKWSADEILGLDPKTGQVLQWWIAYP